MPMRALIAAVFLAAGVAVVTAGVDVQVESDKDFDFSKVKTWDWSTSGPGEVKMARSPYDDPEVARKKAEPIIVDAVTKEMVRRGLTHATVSPDIRVTYYLLLTIGASTQTAGQFLPPVTQWGLPPFAPATVSMTMMNVGSLVLDLAKDGDVKWRGLAQANIKMDADDKKREQLIREGVRDLLAKFPPPKPKK